MSPRTALVKVPEASRREKIRESSIDLKKLITGDVLAVTEVHHLEVGAVGKYPDVSFDLMMRYIVNSEFLKFWAVFEDLDIA